MEANRVVKFPARIGTASLVQIFPRGKNNWLIQVTGEGPWSQYDFHGSIAALFRELKREGAKIVTFHLNNEH